MICLFSAAMLCASDVTWLASAVSCVLAWESRPCRLLSSLCRLLTSCCAWLRNACRDADDVGALATVCSALARLCSCEDSPLLVLPRRLSTSAAWVEKLFNWLLELVADTGREATVFS